MATVTGLTADRMIAMENATVVDGNVVGPDLILVTRDGTQINAGVVQGTKGDQGTPGINGSGFIICTSTTRPVLTPADEGKAIYETDTKLIRLWTGTRWKLQEKIICSSGSHPTGLVAADEGVYIYETDTDLEYVWSGTSWLQAGSHIATFNNAAARTAQWPNPPIGSISRLSDNPNMLWVFYSGAWHSPFPLGQIAYLDNSTDANIPGGSSIDLPGMSFTYTPPVTGRKISVYLSVGFGLSVNTPAASMTLYLTDQANNPYKVRGAQIFGSASDNMSTNGFLTHVMTTGTTPLTFKGRALNWTPGANGLYAQDQTMIIQDIGGA